MRDNSTHSFSKIYINLSGRITITILAISYEFTENKSKNIEWDTDHYNYKGHHGETASQL